jgi:hypothetical protein
MKHTRWMLVLIIGNMLVSGHIVAQTMLGNELRLGDIRLS